MNNIEIIDKNNDYYDDADDEDYIDDNVDEQLSSSSTSKKLKFYNDMSEAEIKSKIEQIKSLRTKNISLDATYMILIHYFTLVLEDIENNRKNKSRKKRFRNYYDIITKYTHIAPRTLKKILNKFNDGDYYETIREGNQNKKECYIPRTNQNIKIIKEYVREKRKELEIVQSRDIIGELKGKGVIDDTYPFNDHALKRNIQRLMIDIGYKIGKKKGAIKENENHILKKLQFLKFMKSNESYRICYSDESYINNHHNYFNKSYFDEHDQDDVPIRIPTKGRRLCFIAAIIGENPYKKEHANDKPHLLTNTIEIFDSSSTVGDYHGNFNSTLYEKWFREKLIPELNKIGGQFAIIIDNAKYHCSLGSELPKQSDSKLTYYQKMSFAGIECDRNLDKCDMIELFNIWKQNALPVIDRIAQENNHIVVRTPEYESELQPIEYLWAHVKSETAKKYKKGTTLTMVRENLMGFFQNVNNRSLVANIIHHTNQKTSALYDYYNDNQTNAEMSFKNIEKETDEVIQAFLMDLADDIDE